MNLKEKKKGDKIFFNRLIEGIIISGEGDELNIFLIFDFKYKVIKEFEQNPIILGLILADDFPFLMIKTENGQWMDAPLAIKIPSKKIRKYHIATINPTTHKITSKVKTGILPDTFSDVLNDYIHYRVNYFPTAELSQYRIERVYKKYTEEHFEKMKKVTAKTAF